MKMVRIIIIIAGLTFALAGNLVAQARLRIPNDRFNMGSIPGNVTAAHNYWFKSIGTDTVFIDSIRTNCGCTLAPLEQNWIAPGDSLRVNICWKTGKVPGPTGNYPYIYTNDEIEKIARVFITGAIVMFPDSLRPLSFRPYIFDLSRFRDIANDSISFTVQNYTDRDVMMRLVSFSLDECDLSIPEIVPAASVVTGYIKVKPEFLDKEFIGSCTVEVEGERTTRVTLPIRRKFY